MLKLRVATAVVLLLILWFAIWAGPLAFAGVMAICFGLVLYEWLRIGNLGPVPAALIAAIEMISQFSLYWAQAQCYACLYAREHAAAAVSIHLVYAHLDTRDTHTFERSFSAAELEDFFRRVTRACRASMWRTSSVPTRRGSGCGAAPTCAVSNTTSSTFLPRN